MKIMSASESRANFAAVLDTVINDQDEVIITRSGKDSVVMLPLDQWESIKETLYLMSNKANHQHLLASIEQVRRGEYERHELIEP